MDFHLEYGLRLRTEPEHKNLYKWAINEVDAKDQQIGDDQIPWPWTLHFTATSCVLNEAIEIGSQLEIKESTPAKREIVQRQIIGVVLRPGSPQDDSLPETTFSMFGTNRAVKNFQLNIHPLTEPDEEERCEAWGAVSYTTEVDFRNETTNDCIIFYLFVKPATFARWAEKISHGSVNEMLLSVRSVAGFYSEWSPSISTDHIKVLTEGSEQNITLPAEFRSEPPRLGKVGGAKLCINRHLEFAKGPVEDEVAENDGIEGIQPTSNTQAPLVERQTVLILASLRRAAWWAVLLLALISITVLLKQ